MNKTENQSAIDEISNESNILHSSNNIGNSFSTAINDNDLIFTIVNKTIKTPVGMRDILVQGDKNSRRIHFILNRYYDGVDLTQKDVYINFINAKSETGSDKIHDITISENKLKFDWFIDSTLTSLEGKVSIQVELCEHDDIGDIIYRYQTKPCDLEISKTIISNGDAEQIDYYLDIKFLNEYTTPIIYEEMVSSSEPITIDNRTMIMPSLNDIAVTQDTRCKLLTFKFSRYIDNVDLSEKTICIKYKLKDGTGDRSFACNQKVTDTILQFDWLLDSKVTSFEGEVEFAIQFIGYNEKNEFYCYNTLPSPLYISKGLDVDGMIEEPSPSWIQSWNILADNYLRSYLKYIKDIQNNVALALKSAEEATLAMERARLSEISAENDANIAWQQADRAERMADITAGFNQTVINIMKEFTEKYKIFSTEYENIRKKDELISENDLSESLKQTIDGKADKDHQHSASDIIVDENHMFVTNAQLSDLKNARLKTIPIKESDLDADLANKINSGSGGSGGLPPVQINGAQIDDTNASFSKVYSSKTTENKIATAIGSAISGMEGLSDNNFTDAEKRKLARIDDNANYFTLTTISASIVEETQDRKFVSPTEKAVFSDKYTKSEVDNLISSLSSGMVWKPDVPTYEDIFKTYPHPIKDWAVSTANGDTYLYDGTAWIKIGSGKTPLATSNSNGLMSSLDKSKLDNIEKNANNYVHPKTHSADMIVPTNDKQFVSTAEKQAILNMQTTINDSLKPYRKNSVKILETDLDQTLLDKLANAGGTIINDNVSSLSQTYSSAIIDAKLKAVTDDYNEKMLNIVNDVATKADIDKLFV
ncbi:hypothetical protein [Lachnoclostridium sp.]|uniref:hypothetical protein n=1 Tax=Lachnoclostridium sp. TaxID=2028282 RepID=UPI00289D9684|nr:hypothetical protein [Lachnoclostridium sp.]